MLLHMIYQFNNSHCGNIVNLRIFNRLKNATPKNIEMCTWKISPWIKLTIMDITIIWFNKEIKFLIIVYEFVHLKKKFIVYQHFWEKQTFIKRLNLFSRRRWNHNAFTIPNCIFHFTTLTQAVIFKEQHWKI